MAVTVVVAAFNAADTIADAVRSALASDAVAQCVVVDDASEDGTAAVAAGLRLVDERVEVVRRRARGGPARARNVGLAAATAQRVCFLDADDALLDGGLERLGLELRSARGAVVALGRFRAVDEHQAPVDVGSWASNQLRPVVRRAGRIVESLDGMSPEALVTRLVSPPPGAWLVDTAVVRAIGGFDEHARRSEDLELLVRLAAAGRVATVDAEVLAYRRHATQRSAAHARRQWGRGHTMWRILRAAPGSAATVALSRGMAAYHLELFAARRRATTIGVRAMGLRNVALALAFRLLGVTAAVLPRRLLAPLEAAASASVD